MKTFLAIVTSSSFAILSASVAIAQSNQCEGLLATAKPGQFYLLEQTNAGLLKSDSKWVPLPKALKEDRSRWDTRLAYIVPAKNGETGSLIIKIARQKASVDTQTASNLRIRVIRREVVAGCRGRFAWDYTSWGSAPTRPQVQTDIGVAEYVFYHKTANDAVEPRLYQFHYEYQDKAGRCISTDDKRNGNREQFLYFNRERDNGLVLANIRRNLGAVANAFGAPDYLEKLLEDKTLRDLRTGYLKYHRLETQLHPYKSPDNVCIPFALPDLEKGETISITVNNLEQRAVNGRLLSGIKRKEATVSVPVR